jgi:hypothetical protein
MAQSQPEKKPIEKARPARLEMVDLIFLAGLVFILVGLGLEVGWGWGLLAIGTILVGMTVWLTMPGTPGEGQ